MKMKSLAFLAFVICLANTVISGGFSTSNLDSPQNKDVPEGVVYAQVFFLVANFNRKAENGNDESEREFFRNYFKTEALLSKKQNQILQTVAKNFTNAFSVTSGEKKLNLSLHYKDELQKLFGTDQFKRFDDQVAFDFDNAAYSQLDDFWAIYISTAYQIDERWDGDPNGTIAIAGITDSLTGAGQGCLLFLETTRAKETTNWNVGPINREYTMAHEIGHKFGAIHSDSDLMSPTFTPGNPPIYRTVGTFSDITLNRMRKIQYP